MSYCIVDCSYVEKSARPPLKGQAHLLQPYGPPHSLANWKATTQHLYEENIYGAKCLKKACLDQYSLFFIIKSLCFLCLLRQNTDYNWYSADLWGKNMAGSSATLFFILFVDMSYCIVDCSYVEKLARPPLKGQAHLLQPYIQKQIRTTKKSDVA